jgi:hypothetical protein
MPTRLQNRYTFVNKGTHMTSNGRVARLTALALATGTLVAAGAGSAAAATSTPTTKLTNKIQALGNGQVVHIRVALPVALPGVGQIIDQYIGLTDGTVTTVTNMGAKSVGTIGMGAVPIISDLLDGSAISDLTGKQSDSVSLVDQDNLAGLGLTLKALVAKSNVAKPTLDGVISHSESTVAAVKLDALTLPALGKTDLTSTLTNTLTTVTGTVQDTTSTIGGVVNTAIGTLNAATNNAAAPVSAPVAAAINTVTTALDTLLATIQQTITSLTSATSLVDLGIMKSEQTITRKGLAVTSHVKNELAGLSLLGGLVSVDALASEASATAGGKPGTASVLHTPGVLTVKVADALTLKVGKTIELAGSLGSALPAELQTTVNSTLATVLGLLRDTLGLDFQPGTAVESVAKDGTSAATTVSSAKLILNPPVIASLLPKGEKLVTVELVGAQAAVGDKIIAQTAVPATPVAKQALPRTGANLPLTAGIATGLMGLAFVARRRRLAISE